MSAHDQEQADIGQEANEREIGWLPIPPMPQYVKDALDPDYVPDEQALVGSILAQLGWAVDDLTTPDHVAILVDADREGLARTVAALDRDILLLATTRDEVAQALARLMEKDLELIAGMGVERSRALKTEWDRDGATRAVRFAIVERWASNGFTNERDRALVDRVLADVATAYSTTPKVNGLKALQIDPNEWRSTTRAERYTVRVTT